MLVAMVTFPAILLFMGISMAWSGKGSIRNALQSKNPAEAVSGGASASLGFKLMIVAIAVFGGYFFMS
ncbi:MAG: hypothetical protein AAGL10_08115 [Pseudomonadota bacterium]